MASTEMKQAIRSAASQLAQQITEDYPHLVLPAEFEDWVEDAIEGAIEAIELTLAASNPASDQLPE
jgi:ubiquinone biosynthesis protein UbiJ